METRLNFIDEEGKERSAEIIFQTTLNGRNYVIYALDKDAENVDLLAARIIKNQDGTISYVDLDENDNKEQINELIQSLIKE